MHECPRCSSADIHRSRVRTRLEAWRKEITAKRPFRCRRCSWRGWGLDLGPKSADGDCAAGSCATLPDAPNLKDTVLARGERPRLNLDELDTDDLQA
jgi:hypothetical protein